MSRPQYSYTYSGGEFHVHAWTNYIPMNGVAQALRVLQALQPDKNILDWRLELSEQVVEAWNDMGCKGTEAEVIPTLMKLWREHRESKL